MAKDYNANSIKVLDYPVCCHVRPGMYIGDTTAPKGGYCDGVLQCVKEALDNAVDEASNKYSNVVGFVAQKDGSFVIYDTGRGIPVEVHPKFKKEKKSTLEVIFTVLHAGGKMDSSNYDKSVGRNGLGISVTNALSSWFRVTTCRNRKWYTQLYQEGYVKSKVRTTVNPSKRLGIKVSKGTVIEFLPLSKVFKDSIKCDLSAVFKWMKFSQYLLPGITFKYENRLKGKSKEFCSTKGIEGYLNKLCKDIGSEDITDTFTLRYPTIDLSLKWVKNDDCIIESYVNGSPTPNGGTHVNGLKKALTACISNYSKRSDSFKPDDLLEGLVCVLNYKMDEPLFDSQTKTKLVNKGTVDDLPAEIEKDLTKWGRANKQALLEIIQRANDIRGAKLQFEQARKAIAAVKGKRGKSSLPPSSKFSVSTTKNAKDRELYIVEGLSAAGTAKAAKDHHYQESLALRGKFLNAEKTTASRLFESDEVLNILKAIGYNSDDKSITYRVGKVIMLSDEDDDGCLDGNTRILTLDGKNPKIKTLVKQYEKDKNPIEVYSVDKDGNLVVGKAIEPRVTRTVNKMIKLTFDNGSTVLCTLNHKWLINNPSRKDDRVIWKDGLGYIQAKDLKETDSIRSVYLENRHSDGSFVSNRYKCIINASSQGKYCDRDTMPVHQWVKCCEQKGWKKYRKAGRGIAIHHIDENPQNNCSSNLKYLTQAEHGKLHIKEQCEKYNGSQKQKDDLAKNWANGVYDKIKDTIIIYNRSKKHRKLVSKMNGDKNQCFRQAMGKLKNYYLTLKHNHIKVNRDNWNLYVGKKGIGGVMTWELFHSKGIKLKDIKTFTNMRESVRLYKLSTVKNCYPTQKLTKFESFCDYLKSKGLSVNKATYNKIRIKLIRKKKLSQGTPKWETIKNHKIVKKEVINSEQEVYCMTVPDYGNFMVADKYGNGIGSSNSHIDTLVCTLLQKLCPDLIEKGMLYKVKAPLFVGRTDSTQYYGASMNDLKRQYKGKFKSITRIKGWGEASASLLREVAFDPATRKLIQIKQSDKKGIQQAKKLLGDDIEARRQLLSEE
jgi:DNA gyrase/topoisomerase IV subunit B